MAFNLIITLIILGALLIIYFFFIKDHIIGTADDATSCEKNGGHCLVMCASGMVQVPAYKCEGAEYVCCKDTEDVTGIPGTGLECEDLQGTCVDAGEECPLGKMAQSPADCEEEDQKCCIASACEKAGGDCLPACPDDYEQLDASCPRPKQDYECCRLKLDSNI